MNEMISVQLAISKLHLQSLTDQPPSDAVTMEALAELNTTIAELEAINAELSKQNEMLLEVTEQRDHEIRRYKELFERIPVAYLVTDEWGLIEELNPASEELLGVRRELLLGKPLSVFVPPPERRAFRDCLNRVGARQTWHIVFQPRGRDRMEVLIEAATIPTDDAGKKRLGLVLQNISPKLAAATAEKMLARETTMRLEAQAVTLRLRALHFGLETMAHDVDMPVHDRITSLLEALVPRFAAHLSCYLSEEPEPDISVGNHGAADSVLQTLLPGPNNRVGRLVAKRSPPFYAEDAAILQSAANGVSLLLFSTAGMHGFERGAEQPRTT